MDDLNSLYPDAERIGHFSHGTASWHAARRQGIGGSDASVLLGHSRWRSPKQLWEMKTQRREPEPGGDYARCGQMLEGAVRTHAFLGQARDGGDLGTLRSRQHPHLLAHVDGVLELDPPVMLEIKTSGRRWYRGVPDYYIDQVQHYMLVTGLTRAIVVCAEVKIDRRRVVEQLDAGELTPEEVVARHCALHRYKLDADSDWQAHYIPLAQEFWERVQLDQW